MPTLSEFDDGEVFGECADCPVLAACPTCAGHNWEVNGKPHQRTNSHCEFILLQMLASAKLAYNRNQALMDKILSGEKDIPTEEAKNLKMTMNNITKAMEVIPPFFEKKMEALKSNRKEE